MQEASYFGHDTGEVHVGMNSRVVLLAILVLRGKIALWRLLARVLHLMALAPSPEFLDLGGFGVLQASAQAGGGATFA